LIINTYFDDSIEIDRILPNIRHYSIEYYSVEYRYLLFVFEFLLGGLLLF
jgi:hypothetical protein